MILKGKKFVLDTTTTPPPPPPPTGGGNGSGKVTIEVLLGGPAGGATASFAELFANKRGSIQYEWDDATKSIVDVLNYTQGGFVSVAGQSFPAKAQTDGCGKSLPWGTSLAVNVASHWTNLDLLTGGDSPHVHVSQLAQLCARRCAVNPHGFFHFDDDNGVHNPPSAPYWYKGRGFNKSMNVSENTKYIYEHTGFYPRTFTRPQDSLGYNAALKTQKYFAISSQVKGEDDAVPRFPKDTEAFNTRVSYVKQITAEFFESLRGFIDAWDDATQRANIKQYLTNVKNMGTPENPVFYRFGSHGIDAAKWPGFKEVMDHIDTLNSDDSLWITDLQSMCEYLETKRTIQKTEVIEGNKLTITLDYSNIPRENVSRDITLLINTTQAITSITVNGAQDDSHSLSKKMVNVYNRRVANVMPYTEPVVGAAVPYDPDFDVWFDNSAFPKYTKLRDGDISENVFIANGKNNLIYYPSDLVFELGRFRVSDLVRVEIGVANGQNVDVEILAERADTGALIACGTYTGTGYLSTTPFPAAIRNVPISRVRLRTKGDSVGFGSEVNFIGTFQPPAANPYRKPRTKLGYQSGWNIHPWDLTRNFPNTSVNEPKIQVILSLESDEGAFRMYNDLPVVKTEAGFFLGREIRGFHTEMGFQRLKQQWPNCITWRASQGQTGEIAETWDVSDNTKYIEGTVNPGGYQDNGGWGGLTLTVTAKAGTGSHKYWHVYDGGTMVDRADQLRSIDGTNIGQSVYFDVGGGKGAIYPAGKVIRFRKSQASHVNVPWYPDGDLRKREFEPYQNMADLTRVTALRAGQNTEGPDYPVGPGEQVLKGINTDNWTETMNEPGHFWEGYDQFWNGGDCGPMWSMNFDGHKGLFPNSGAKNGDPKIKVSTSGMASDSLDFVYGMQEWVIKHRGYNPDGTINWPFDILQIHCYPSAGGQYSDASGGLPPERSMFPQIYRLVRWAETYAPGIELIVGECGYDKNAGSPLNSRPFGQYSNAQQVGAMWWVRAMFGFSFIGLDRLISYRLMQDGNYMDNSARQFDTMEAIRPLSDDPSNTVYNRTIIGDYHKQYNNVLKRFVPEKAISEGTGGLWCIQYHNPETGARAIVAWREEIIAFQGSEPTFTEQTGAFNVPIPDPTATLTVRTFVDDGSGVMSSAAAPSGSTLSINCNSRPKVIIVTPQPT